MMNRKSLIAALAAASMSAAHAAASVVNVCGIGAADAVETIDGGAQRTITAGEGLIDSHPAHLTVYRVALNRSIEGPWDSAIAPILPIAAGEPIAIIGDALEVDIVFRATSTLDRTSDLEMHGGITSSLQLDAQDLEPLAAGPPPPRDDS